MKIKLNDKFDSIHPVYKYVGIFLEILALVTFNLYDLLFIKKAREIIDTQAIASTCAEK